MTANIGEKLDIRVRDAVIADMEAVREIYNHYVRTSTATFDMADEAPTQRLDWFAHHQAEGLPVIVAEVGGKVVGWGSHSYYHSRCAYRTTIEPSIYVHPDFVGKGIGRRLMQSLLTLAEDKGYHVLVGKICSENTTSIQMCKSFGFELVGELREVGCKFDRWLNVTLMQKIIK
jgi:phosphinothricin acetyltransferase